MDEKRWQRIEEVCGEALERPTGDREAFIEGACGDDVALKDIVLSLIHYDEDDPEFLEVPLVVSDDTQPEEGPLPERVGPFSVVRLLGRGGMGQVYLCERSGEGFRLRVAVKLIRKGLDADDVLRRFRIERRILASLNHPGIARFLDGGGTEDGRPYFVMEYVDGIPLLDFCDRASSSVEARIRLFLSVCDAVEHAHKRLIVHRDLKPSNVLVTAEGTPKLLDFGVAKVLSEEDDWGPVEATRTGARLLTPQYASP